MRLAFIGLMLGTVAQLACAAEKTITVSAGSVDRRQSIVCFAVPSGSGPWRLKDASGQVLPVQVVGGQGFFILPSLPAKQTRTYTIESGEASQGPSLELSRKNTAVSISLAGKPILTYQGDKTPLPDGYAAEFQRGGYIHPVYSPAGKLVSDDYPPNHKHHHGIWAPWTRTIFEDRKVDFWNMGAKTGTVEFVALDETFSGPVCAGLKSRHRFVDLSATPEPKAALNEQWQVTVYNTGRAEEPCFVFDLVSVQTCATESPLLLPKYHYGGLAFRGHRSWDGKGNATYISSEGHDRANGNEATARWCQLSGLVDGQAANVAVLCHRSNFRFPQPVRIHPTEPYFCYTPSMQGDWKIKPGQTYVARYRFVVTDGPADKDLIERLWKDYAEPVKVN